MANFESAPIVDGVSGFCLDFLGTTKVGGQKKGEVSLERTGGQMDGGSFLIIPSFRPFMEEITEEYSLERWELRK